jgi:hypothetical protein
MLEFAASLLLLMKALGEPKPAAGVIQLRHLQLNDGKGFTAAREPTRQVTRRLAQKQKCTTMHIRCIPLPNR